MNKNKESIKQKNDLFKSIMKNPKLARTLQDGLSAPLGSTKREQAKSILSIMKKAKGVNNIQLDATGGLYSNNSTVSPAPDHEKNYGNMMIFPAAPKLKQIKKVEQPQQKQDYNGMGGFDGQGGWLGDTVKNLFGNTVLNTINPALGPVNTLYNTAKDTIYNYNQNKKNDNNILNNTQYLSQGKEPAPYQKGIVEKAAEGVGNAVWNVAKETPRVLGGTLSGVAGAVQYGVQNTLAGLDKINKTLFGYDPNKPDTSVKPISYSNTWGGDISSDLFSKYYKNTDNKPTNTQQPSNTQQPQNIQQPSNTQQPQNIQQPVNNNIESNTKDINKDQTVSDNKNSQIFNKDTTNTGTDTGTSNSKYSNNITDAVKNVSSFMNVDPSYLTSVGINDLAKTYGTDQVAYNFINYLFGNEGSSPSGVQNNPGNIKYNGSTGQINSGIEATDGGTFASYSTLEEGKQAAANIIKSIINGGTSYGENPTLAQVVNGWTNSGNNSSGSNFSSGSITDLAQDAVDNNYGAANFALGFADQKFGGSLDQYVDNLDKKLRSDFGLEELETQLSDLKSMKENFIPTLTSYVGGKDKYLKVIDKMISQAEDGFMNVDMSDPQASNSYRNYMNYLYTLKGRQSERYGNYLNSAISDYNAQVTKATEDYKDVYDKYESALTRGSTIAQSEYNNLVTRMNSLYTELQNAPINAINLQTAQQQLDQNNLTLAQNALAQYMGTDKDYMKKVGDYTDYITDKDEKLDMNKVSDGLSSLFTENDLQGGNNVAMTKAIERAMMTTLSADNSQETVSKLQNMITSLASDPQYAQYGSALNSAMSSKIQELTSDYVLGKIGEIKDASKDLVKGGWFSKSGLEDKESWINNYKKSLPETFLNSLYNTFANNIQPGSSYAENPMNYYRAVFSGATDEENAKNLAARMAISS